MKKKRKLTKKHIEAMQSGRKKAQAKKEEGALPIPEKVKKQKQEDPEIVGYELLENTIVPVFKTEGKKNVMTLEEAKNKLKKILLVHYLDSHNRP